MKIACIAAAGSGTRMNLAEVNKQFLPVDNIPLIAHCVNAYSIDEIDHIIVAVQDLHIEQTKVLIKMFCKNPSVYTIAGGNTRNETILKMVQFAENSLNAKDDDILLTHDAARPLIKKQTILDNLEILKDCECAGTAIKCNDTVYSSDDGKTVTGTPDRTTIYLAQTPQSFRISDFIEMRENTCGDIIRSNADVCTLFRNLGFKVMFSQGDVKNIKITTDEDFTLARAFAALSPEHK